MTRLQVLRKKKGLTQAEFSKAAKTSLRYIQDLEQGRVNISGVHIETLVKFGSVLDVPFTDLLEDRRVATAIIMQLRSGPGPEAGPAQQKRFALVRPPVED